MKSFRSLLSTLVLLLGAGSLAFATSAPSLDVVVSNSSGKVVFKGRTNAEGVFTTSKLAPGNYVVQFNSTSSLKGGPFALVVGAGEKKVVANAVAGTKFAQGGVAMKVQVGPTTMSLTGQVAAAGSTAQGTTPPNGERMEHGQRVKYVDGKKFVWVQSEIGSNLGARWVEASSVEGRQAHTVSRQDIQDRQARTQTIVPPGAPTGR